MYLEKKNYKKKLQEKSENNKKMDMIDFSQAVGHTCSCSLTASLLFVCLFCL